MQLLRRKFLQFVFVIVSIPFSLQLLAQTQSSSPYIPSVIPPSPNAATLMKFTDVPVSPYTGTADISIPIYTIQARGITVPVSLDYNTGGIKLKEEAGWVGLGWALNAGGMISRTIMDHDDFGTGVPYFTNSIAQLAGDMTAYHPNAPVNSPFLANCYYDFYCNYLASTTSGNEDFWNAFTASTTVYDMEPDIFSYSFPGHSGKFILTRSGKVVLQKQENINIQFATNGTSFTITDEQGNVFYFLDKEYAQPSGSSQNSVSSWLLSKIITEQRDSVMFTYAAGGASASVQSDINQTYSSFCTSNAGPTTVQAGPTLYSNLTLQNINFANGQLQFLFDEKRSDLSNGYKLDSVVLYSKSASGALTYQREHDFFYSYFNGTYPSGADSFEFYRLKLDSIKQVSTGLSIPPYSFVYNDIQPGALSAKHSFNVDHWGYFNGTSNNTFIPSINTVYNPPGSNSQVFTYSGANREPNFEYTETFSLQQVNYPTGGKTVLGYQNNDYDYTNSTTGPSDFQYVNVVNMDTVFNIINHGTTSGTIDLSHILQLSTTLAPYTNLTLSVSFIYQNNYTVPNFPYENTSNKLYFNFTGTNQNIHQDVNGATCQSGSPACTATIPVQITSYGVYNWNAYIDPSIDTVATFSEIHVTAQYQITQANYNLLENNSYISPASGLRIQSITNYKDPVNIASEKTYSYNYTEDKTGSGSPQQYTYGRLMSFPSYVRYVNIPNSVGGYCTNLNLFSSSNSSLSSVIQGNVVGYDQVTEYSIDPSTGLDNGKTVYQYYNAADTPIFCYGFRFPGIFNIGNTLNGMLLSKADYSDNGGEYQKISESDNYYHTTNRSIYYSPRYQYVYPRSGLNPSNCIADTAVESETIANFYPSVKSERILMDSSYQYTYDQNNPLYYVLSVSRNYYDNPVHYQVTRNNIIDSKGNSQTTRLKYPQDFIPNGQTVTGNTILDTMIGRNMISETIEKQDSLYYSGSATGYVTGAQLNLYRILPANSNTVVHDKTYKLDIQSPVTNFMPFAINGNTTSLDSRNRQMASFDQYDAYNNLQQYTTTDQNPVTILWDYVNVYPVAQAKNAVVADVAATSFEADGSGNWIIPSATRDSVTSAITGYKSYSLANGAISRSGLTSTTTYIVSYWSHAGSSYTVSGSIAVKQGKTINGWTFFEHTVSGITSVSISGSSNIDELRLYPSTAQMTTYTYSPLVGMTTSCDADNKITYYFYDNLSRLKWIKDQDGNILKTFQYHYQGVPGIFY